MQERSTFRRSDSPVNDTLALVLAGGNGTRLKTLTRWHSKPAIPFGGEFKTIDFTLSNCLHSGIRRIGVLTQYKSHSLNCHIQRGWNFFNAGPGQCIELLPAQQRLGGNWYDGTADAIYQNLDIIEHHTPEQVLILAGDHVYSMDYGLMLAEHRATGADVTVGCIEVGLEAARGFGVMAIDETRRIREFQEKPDRPRSLPGRPDRALASMGIYVFNTDFLRYLLVRDALNPDSSHDFGRDILPGIIDSHRVNAHPFKDRDGGPGYWRDVGTLDSYWQTHMDMLGEAPRFDVYNDAWPIWTAQEQLPPAKFLYNAELRCQGSATNSIVSSGCVVNGASVRDSVLFRRTRVEPGSTVAKSLLLPGARVGGDCYLNRVIVDQNCEIPPGTVIGADPARDAQRFTLSADGIVLVSADDLRREVPAEAPRERVVA